MAKRKCLPQSLTWKDLLYWDPAPEGLLWLQESVLLAKGQPMRKVLFTALLLVQPGTVKPLVIRHGKVPEPSLRQIAPVSKAGSCTAFEIVPEQTSCVRSTVGVLASSPKTELIIKEWEVSLERKTQKQSKSHQSVNMLP